MDTKPFEQKLEVQTFIKLDFIDSIKILFGRTIQVSTTIIVPQEDEIPRINTYSKTEIVKTSTHFIKKDRPNFGYSPK